jgi:hypothetical protein
MEEIYLYFVWEGGIWFFEDMTSLKRRLLDEP